MSVPMKHLLELLRAAGEPTRLRVLLLLQEGELTVTELVQILGQSQPRVSRHLKLLAGSGLVEWVREGSWVFYRLSRDEAGGALVQWIARQSEKSNSVDRRDAMELETVRKQRQAVADEYFQKNAKQWDQIRALQGSDAAIEDAFLKAARPLEGARLLDIGTGTGRMLEVFADHIAQGIGIDGNAAMLSVARARLLKAGLQHCQVQMGDMYALEEADNSQDIVILHQVLHFANAPERVLAEASRVLAPGGQLLMADYAPHAHEVLRDKHAHRRLGFSKQDIQRWSEKAGLQVRHVKRVSGPELEIDVWDATKTAENTQPHTRNEDAGYAQHETL